MFGKIIFISFLILASLFDIYNFEELSDDSSYYDDIFKKFDHVIDIDLTLFCRNKPFGGSEIKLEQFHPNRIVFLAKGTTDENGHVKLEGKYKETRNNLNCHALVTHNCSDQVNGQLQSFFITFASKIVKSPTSSAPLLNLHTFELSKTKSNAYYNYNNFKDYIKQGIIIVPEKKEETENKNEIGLDGMKKQKKSLILGLNFYSKISEEKIIIRSS